MNILVTGGSTGLGAHLVNDILNLGHKVFFTYNRTTPLINRPNCVPFKIDFSNSDELKIFLTEIKHWEIDILINNFFNPIDKSHAHKLNRELILYGISRNVIPTIEITNCILTSMRQNRSGKIINILTDYLLDTIPTGLSQYVAEKSYIESFMRSVLHENKSFNISIDNIYPKIMFTTFAQINSTQKDQIIHSGQFSEIAQISKLITHAIQQS